MTDEQTPDEEFETILGELVELLEQLGLDVGAGEHVRDVEQRRHRRARMPLLRVGEMEIELLEEVRQAQPGTALLVQRMLENGRLRQ